MTVTDLLDDAMLRKARWYIWCK